MELKDLVSFGDIRKSLPGDVQVGTLTRWALRGVRAVSGERVFLQSWKIKGQRYTTPKALSDFLDATSKKTESKSAGPPPHGLGIHEPDPAARELVEAGLLIE